MTAQAPRWTMGILIALAGFYWIYTTFLFPQGVLRYRMTVEAVADGQLITGTGVIQVTYTKQGELAAVAITTRTRGEAVTLDFGSRGVLFFILKNDPERAESIGPTEMVTELNIVSRVGSLTPEQLRGLADIDAQVELPFSRLPMIVTFRDLNDPMSVERVFPGELFRAVGQGASLRRVVIETTRDSITVGIRDKLPWLDEYYNKHFDGRRIEIIEAENGLANSLAAGFFSTER